MEVPAEGGNMLLLCDNLQFISKVTTRSRKGQGFIIGIVEFNSLFNDIAQLAKYIEFIVTMAATIQ